MPAPPPYMRFYPDDYCRDTIELTMEEQGVYMRLLCLMWLNGGKVKNDDSLIVKALPIERNKWLKVKPQLKPFLTENLSGYLTQKRLQFEYNFSAGITKALKENAQGAAPVAAGGAATPAATPAAPLATQNGTAGQQNELDHESQAVHWLPEGGVARALARALDQSKSKPNQNTNIRFLEDCVGENCGQLDAEERAERFIREVIAAFAARCLQPPLDYDVVKGWIEKGCDPFLHILQAVKATLERFQPGTKPPRSWKYFAKEVYQLKRKET